MKKFTLSLAFAVLMTAVALIFSGCSDDPEVGPEAPVISAKDMQVPATAGKQKLAYSIAHPVEGQSISAESDQTWIHDFEYTTQISLSRSMPTRARLVRRLLL